MVENQNVNINLIYRLIVSWPDLFVVNRQGVPLQRGLHQLGASTNPNKCIAYPRTLYPKEYTLAWPKLYPDLTCTGYSQHGLYLGLKRPRPDYTRVYYSLGQLYTPGYIMASAGMNWPRPYYTPGYKLAYRPNIPGYNSAGGILWPVTG